MPIDTTNEKLALLEWGQLPEGGMPIDETAGFSQGDRQQLLFGYPGILWEEKEPEQPQGGAGWRRRRR